MSKQTGKIEIMAPVGSYESLAAAIQAGADSVYFGVGHLNMRSKSSQNFTVKDLGQISSICHQNNVRSYITLNTVIYDEELESMRTVVDAAKENRISAVIASDMSVIQYAREKALEVHMSTQTNITNIEAVKYYSQFADVMVMARELNVRQVKQITEAIRKEGICGPEGKPVQVEMFVHGALCMAVSGKCYMSLDLLNSSANRGACLQPCRRAYRVMDNRDEVEMEVDNEYIMSPKDLKTINFLDKILKAGVTVLKIEGRGRSPEYVRTVVSVYKQAIKAYFENDFSEKNIEEWNRQLKTVYNRDFWDGYYLGKRLGEWTKKPGSQATKKKVFVGSITNYYSKIGVAEIRMQTHELNINDDILIIGPTTGVIEEQIREVRVDMKNVNTIVKCETGSIPVRSMVRRSDKVYKLIDVDPDFDPDGRYG
ncbi:MAG: U32 family peptidase [Bacteroidales bacterium]|nr:U32 family peptidase [Bacteroidales bacterium]